MGVLFIVRGDVVVNFEDSSFFTSFSRPLAFHLAKPFSHPFLVFPFLCPWDLHTIEGMRPNHGDEATLFMKFRHGVVWP